MQFYLQGLDLIKLDQYAAEIKKRLGQVPGVVDLDSNYEPGKPEVRVRINRDKATQAAEQVKPGDVLTIALDRRVLVYRVLDPGMRRGPAEEARKLYEDLSPPAARKDAAAGAAAPEREPGSGRPTKRERRDTDRLQGGS